MVRTYIFYTDNNLQVVVSANICHSCLNSYLVTHHCPRAAVADGHVPADGTTTRLKHLYISRVSFGCVTAVAVAGLVLSALILSFNIRNRALKYVQKSMNISFLGCVGQYIILAEIMG